MLCSNCGKKTRFFGKACRCCGADISNDQMRIVYSRYSGVVAGILGYFIWGVIGGILGLILGSLVSIIMEKKTKKPAAKISASPVVLMALGIVLFIVWMAYNPKDKNSLVSLKTATLSPKQENKIREDVAVTETIKMRVRNHFKDPESVEIRNVQLFRQGPADGTVWGYALCGEVNAKNSFGGYVGYRRFFYTAFADGNSKIREDDNFFDVEPDDAAQANQFSKKFQDECSDQVISTSDKNGSTSTNTK